MSGLGLGSGFKVTGKSEKDKMTRTKIRYTGPMQNQTSWNKKMSEQKDPIRSKKEGPIRNETKTDHINNKNLVDTGKPIGAQSSTLPR